MLLFYLRHGDRDIEPGSDSDSLSPLGMRQAEALGRRLAQLGIDEIYASSAHRAQQTAAPACELMHKEMKILDWANEKYVKSEFAVPLDEQHKTWVFHHPKFMQILASEEVRALGKRWYDHPALDSERFRSGVHRVQREVDLWLAGFGYRHDLGKNMYDCVGCNNRRIALFAHQGFSVSFMSSILDIPYAQYAVHFDIQHSGMTVIHFPEKEGWGVAKVLQISNDSHLYMEGLPTLYNDSIRI